MVPHPCWLNIDFMGEICSAYCECFSENVQIWVNIFFQNVLTHKLVMPYGIKGMDWYCPTQSSTTPLPDSKWSHQSSPVASTPGQYRQVSNIRRTSVGTEIVDHSDVVGASPVGAAPTTSEWSTEHLASLDWEKTTARRGEKHLSLVIWCVLY